MSAAFSALFEHRWQRQFLRWKWSVCGRDVLCSTDAVYDRVIDCFRICSRNGSHTESFHVTDIPALTVETGLKMGVIALGCAIISIIFCIALNGAVGLLWQMV